MVRSSLSHGTPASRLFFALVASAWALFLMPVQVVRAEPSPTLSAEDRKSLEIAFELLENSLSAEAELKWLVIFKKLTFQGPAKEVEGIMKKIQRASETRAKEFQSLRKLAPSVTAAPPPSQPSRSHARRRPGRPRPGGCGRSWRSVRHPRLAPTQPNRRA